MNERKLSQAQKFKKLELVLEEIKTLGKLKGVILADRDGVLITENVGEDKDYNMFSAMCASVLESAEGLGHSIGGNVSKIITELDEQTIVIIQCENKTFLSFIIEKDSHFGLVLDKMADYKQKIEKLL
ncbi:MAG: roadblock/LC7 domain-containing protein [Promethearchaeota archaeon]|jgi:predicted regulator of Ras-like GTPase activity (Roadblock/LC7/MglB family)